MKVKRSILESIVRAVIREQVEDESEQAEETTRDTLESVMRITGNSLSLGPNDTLVPLLALQSICSR